MPGDRLGALGGAASEQPGDFLNGECLHFEILAARRPFPGGASSRPRRRGTAALLVRALVPPPAGPAAHTACTSCSTGRPPPKKNTGLLRPAGERGVARRQEDQVIHVGAGQTERHLIVHDQQAAGTGTLGTCPVLE